MHRFVDWFSIHNLCYHVLTLTYSKPDLFCSNLVPETLESCCWPSVAPSSVTGDVRTHPKTISRKIGCVRTYPEAAHGVIIDSEEP